MPLKTLDAPCWRLTTANGADHNDPDPGPAHFDTEADAAKRADYSLIDDHDDQGRLTPKQWDQPCVLIVCDGCGADPEDDEYAHIHFPDEETARAMVGVYDWAMAYDTAAVGGVRILCESCQILHEDDDEDDD